MIFIGDSLIRNRSERTARAAIFITIDERVVSDNLSTLEVKFKSHLPRAQRNQGIAPVLLVPLLAKQKKESASSRTGNLSSDGSIANCSFIHLIDVCIGNF